MFRLPQSRSSCLRCAAHQATGLCCLVSIHRQLTALLFMMQVSVPPLEAGLLQVTLDDVRRLPADDQVRRG